MPETEKGIFYPGPEFPFPPGFSGEGSAFQLLAESVDTSMDAHGLVRIDGIRTLQPTNQVGFSDIPQVYEDLFIVWAGRTNDAANDPDMTSLNLQFNGDAGADQYRGRRVALLIGSSPAWAGGVATSSTTGAVSIISRNASSGIIHIPRYRRGISKDAVCFGAARAANANTAANHMVTFGRCVWTNTAAITSLRLNPSGPQVWAAGCTLTLYGTPSEE